MREKIPVPPWTTFPSTAGGEPVVVPLTGELDLHTFRPEEVGDLVPEFIRACQEAGILRLRLVHGKGKGTLRETVHALLRRDPRVHTFRLGDETSGSWGATVVGLKPFAG